MLIPRFNVNHNFSTSITYNQCNWNNIIHWCDKNFGVDFSFNVDWPESKLILNFNLEKYLIWFLLNQTNVN